MFCALAKRGRSPWPARRLGAFAQRGRAHCTSWASCRELFGLFRAKRAILSLHAGGWCGRRSQRINLTQAVSRQKEWLLRVHDNGEERLRSMKSCRDVIHDASNLLDVRPASVVELSVASFARTKDQTADGTWSRKHSVHGLVAQKRRAGVLATAGARAWPTLHSRGRAVCRTVRMHDADHANLPKHTRPDPKMHQDPRKAKGAHTSN